MRERVSNDGATAVPLVPVEAERSPKLPPIELAVGLAAGAASLVVYATSGFGPYMVILWAFAVLSLTATFAIASWPASGVRALGRPPWPEVAIPLGIAALLSPLYLVRVHDWPVQVGSDEVVVMSQAERWAALENVDLFGLTDVFGIPALLFVALGNAADVLGGADLEHMRLIHGFLGVVTIAVAYTLFRQLLPCWWAAVAAALLGVNHSFLMISRMALRENSAVLLEVAALPCSLPACDATSRCRPSSAAASPASASTCTSPAGRRSSSGSSS